MGISNNASALKKYYYVLTLEKSIS